MPFKDYSDIKSQQVLRTIRDNPFLEIRFSISHDGRRVLESLQIPDLEMDEAEKILENLHRDKILFRDVIETYYACPSCKGMGLLLSLECPYCHSKSIEKKNIIEHLTCAYIDSEEVFVRGDKLICPKCNKALKAIGVDYRKNMQYICLKERAFFTNPDVRFKCISCGKIGDLQDAEILALYEYRLDRTALKNLESLIIDLKPIVEELTRYNWVVEQNAKVQGTSGLEYTFTLIAQQNLVNPTNLPSRLCIDVIMNDKPLTEHEALALVAKVLDVKKKGQKIIVAVSPAISENAMKLFSFHDIEVTDAPSPHELIKKLHTKISQILREARRKSLEEEKTTIERLLKEITKI